MTSSLARNAFVAGASGAIGEVLCKLLLQDGWRVVGTTRSPERAARLRSLGVEPVVVDVFDRTALIDAVGAARPEVVVHQLTALPKQANPASMAAARAGNARVREVGTANLVAAAVSSGARRLVAQSIAFAYLPGPMPYPEDAPLDTCAWAAVVKLEQLVSNSGLEGVVLRYGRLYGPNTWTAVPPAQGPVHVEAAADAARRALTLGNPGVYNISEDDGTVTIAKARRDLRWQPEFRLQGRAG